MSSHLLRQLFGARLTIALVLIWLMAELIRSSVFPQSDAFYMCLGLSRGGLQSLFLWQPLTYAFVHGGWVHLLMNQLLILILGMRLEWMLGRRSLAWLLLGGMLAGGVLYLCLNWNFERAASGWNILVGGSGAVFAALLCMTTLSPESRWWVPFPLSAKNLGRGLMLSFLILILIDPGLGVPFLSQLGVALVDAGWGDLFRISHACHLGGALAGWSFARWTLRHRVTLASLRRDRAALEARRRING